MCVCVCIVPFPIRLLWECGEKNREIEQTCHRSSLPPSLRSLSLWDQENQISDLIFVFQYSFIYFFFFSVTEQSSSALNQPYYDRFSEACLSTASAGACFLKKPTELKGMSSTMARRLVQQCKKADKHSHCCNDCKSADASWASITNGESTSSDR